jgi:hypothetical protein
MPMKMLFVPACAKPSRQAQCPTSPTERKRNRTLGERKKHYAAGTALLPRLKGGSSRAGITRITKE